MKQRAELLQKPIVKSDTDSSNTARSPFFSIIVPTYNRADFIAKAIDSVLAQEFVDFELIVVDDGSTDNTADVLRDFTDKRVIYFRKPNEERAAARNKGVELSRGAYVNFFDSDDLLYPNHLATAFRVIEERNMPEFFHVAYDVRNSEGDVTSVMTLNGDPNERLIHGNFLSCNGVFLKKSVAEANPFNSQRALSASEDYELWLRLASRFPLHHDNTVTSSIVNHDERSTLSSGKAQLVERMELLEAALAQDEMFLSRYGHHFGRFRADNCTYIALHLALAKTHRLDVLKYLLQSARLSPHVFSSRRFYAAIKHLP